jgi:hypothetical protein
MSDNPQRDAERRQVILDWMRILLYAAATIVLLALAWAWNRPHPSHPIAGLPYPSQLPVYWNCERTDVPPPGTTAPAPK